MAKSTRTIKVYEETYRQLRLHAASTGETMMNLIERLIREEKARVQDSKLLTVKVGELSPGATPMF